MYECKQTHRYIDPRIDIDFFFPDFSASHVYDDLCQRYSGGISYS